MDKTVQELEYVLSILEAEAGQAFQDHLRPERLIRRWVYLARRNFWRLPQQSNLQRSRQALLLAESQIKLSDLRKYAERVRDLFREYLDAWFDEEKNSDALMQRRADIRHQIQHFLKKHRGFLLPSSDGPSEIIYAPALHLPPKTEAARLLLAILTSPFCSRVQRCDRCRRIYLQKTNYRNKRFCARSCGNSAWRQRPSVTAEEEQRLKTAKTALSDWAKSAAAARGENWKPWIHKRTRLSLNWLTRRQRSGSIRPPKES
jgi:hypothetical protein